MREARANKLIHFLHDSNSTNHFAIHLNVFLFGRPMILRGDKESSPFKLNGVFEVNERKIFYGLIQELLLNFNLFHT